MWTDCKVVVKHRNCNQFPIVEVWNLNVKIFSNTFSNKWTLNCTFKTIHIPYSHI